MADQQAGRRSKDAGFGIAGLLAGAICAAGGAWILYSRYGINHRVNCSEAIASVRESSTSTRVGRVSYYVDRRASEGTRPLVLVHSVNAAASAYEMKPLFEQYRGTRPVFALDLPGFGFSERSNRIYSAQLYQDALIEFLDGIVGQPADVVALSMGSEFAARAAVVRPDLFHSLSMISPTGLGRLALSTGGRAMGGYGLDNALHPVLSLRLWALPLFDSITSRSCIAYFLKKNFLGHIPPGYTEYAYTTAHQPGAEYSPLYFLSGKLSTPQVIEQVYARLRVPSLAIYDRDPNTTFEELPNLLLMNPYWQAVRMVPSLGLPQFERTADTVELLNSFWHSLK